MIMKTESEYGSVFFVYIQPPRGCIFVGMALCATPATHEDKFYYTHKK